MIPAWFSAFFNHVWQSTLFAAAMWLLILTLKKTNARTRYWLWLAASVKFLIPFALLVSLGRHFEWRTGPINGPFDWSSTIQQVSQPFPTPTASQPMQSAVLPATPVNQIPTSLFAIWACGFVTILFFWWRRWRNLYTIFRAASPSGSQLSIPILASPALVEPGIFGICRPVLLLPEGIRERLTTEQLNAIFAHEMCHVRYWDNLTAAIHMLVEAIFWFHPLVWWLGTRLIDERERACDEAVLQSGNEPQVYAEGILNVCKFYVESPLACAAGVTGANLKRRIETIMMARIGHGLTLGRKLLLAGAAISAIAGPFLIGLMNAPTKAQASTADQNQADQNQAVQTHPTFAVATIKPSDPDARGMQIMFSPGGRFTAKGVLLKSLVGLAYNVRDFQISGGPAWMNSERYDITAKTEDADAEDPRTMTEAQRDGYQERQRLRIQALLAERFQLKVGHTSKELPIYALVVAKGGPKLTQSKEGGSDQHQGLRLGPGQLTAQKVPMRFFVEHLSRQLGRSVVDNTGLVGNYDFTLTWTPDQNEIHPFGGGPVPQGPNMPPPPDPNGPSLFTALQEQLGLKLESKKGPVEILIIDQIEKPSEN